jgi:DNA polymerase III delta prime subunit
MEARDLLSFLGLGERENLKEKMAWIVTGVINAINWGRVPESIKARLREIDESTGLENRILAARASLELESGENSRIILILGENKSFSDKNQLCFPATTELIVNGESRGNAVVIVFNPRHPILRHPILNRRKQKEELELELREEELVYIIGSLLQAQAMVENADKNREPLLTQGEFAEVMRSP